MGFFKDFKRDFAQAVNELMPDKDELGAEYDDEDMVNTFDENDQMDVAPEDLLENLDEIRIDKQEEDTMPEVSENLEHFSNAETAEETGAGEETSVFDTVPEAEVITDDLELDPEPFSEEELNPKPDMEYLQAETVTEKTEEPDTETETGDDELKALDALDEENMLEHTDEALQIEPDTEKKEDELSSFLTADLGKAVEDTLAKQAEEELEAENNQIQEDMTVETTTAMPEEKTDVNALIEADTTYITKSTVINGDLQTDGCIDLIGTVNGAVSCDGKLIVGGTVTGDVQVGELYANAARIEGDVHVVDAAKIGVGTVVVGNVFAGSAVIAGAVKGDIDVQGPVIVDSTAVIMGNIKSKSVQINNGAVIEGMCSQCYSEIDVKSFFE